MLLAASLASLTVIQWAILVIVVAGVIGIVMVVLKQIGVQIPPFIVTILWIILAVVVGIAAIKLIWSML